MTELYAALVAAAVTFLITWGATRSKVSDLEQRNVRTEQDVESLKSHISKTREDFATQLHSLREVYVGYNHFNEAMQMMRESHRDLKEDMQKVLGLLSKRQ